MNVTVSVSGKFSMGYLWAAYLERRGMLERLITPVPYRRGARYGVSHGRTASVWPVGAMNYALRHAEPRALRSLNQLAASVAFDEAASRMLGGCDVFNGWASMSLRSIRRAKERGVPSVLTLASMHIATQTRLLEEEARRWRVERPLTHPQVVRRTLREYEEADVLVAPAQSVARTYVDEGVDPKKIAVVPWGVHPVTAEGVDRSSREGPLRLLFAGALSARKGVPYLLEAFRRLSHRAELRLVGPVDGALLRALGGLPDGAQATGTKTGDALAAEFRAADVFVLPSVEDGFGVVVTEAMAAGLPVIVSDGCGSADAVRDGVNGYVVPARDSQALAGRIDELAADGDLRLRMGEAARTSVAGWTWDDAGYALVRTVFEPLARRGRWEADHAVAA